jgi:hypothetical protein
MLSEWTAECSEDAPTLVVPWSDPESGARFLDLRSEPYDLAEVEEAESYPALGRALRALNAARSPLLTVKCDAWMLPGLHDADKLEALRMELDLSPEEARVGFGSYIDVLWRERAVFASAHHQQERLDRLVRRSSRLPHTEAAAEFVLRPALLDLNGPLEGFGCTVYVYAVAPEPDIAQRRWELALEDITALLRDRNLEPRRGSATIDAADAFPLRVRHLNSSSGAGE